MKLAQLLRAEPSRAERPVASGMTCARRLAGAHRPAPSAGCPRKSDLRPGRRRARLSLLLPALALLLGALGLFAAAPAQAQNPATPPNLQVTAGDQMLTVTWDAPSYTVESVAVRWRVKDTDPNTPGNQAGSWIPTDGATSEVAQRENRRVPIRPWACTGCDVLTNGVTYEVHVEFARATADGGGTTGWVSAGEGTPEAPPSPTVPQNVAVTAGDAEFTITWEAPSSWGAWTAGGFEIEWKPRDAPVANWTLVKLNDVDFTPATDDTSFVFAGLQAQGVEVHNDAFYSFRIRAYSQEPGTDGMELSHFRTSDWVTVTSTKGVSSLALQVTEGDSRLDLSWTAATPPSGFATTAYQVDYTSSTSAGSLDAVGSDSSMGWVTVSRTGTTTTQAITGLTNGTSYRVRVRALFFMGMVRREGLFAFATGTPMESTAPSVPQNVAVTAGDAQLTLSWQAPSSWGSYTAAGFEIEWKDSTEPSSAWKEVAGHGQTVTATTTSFVFEGAQPITNMLGITVTNHDSYDLRIRAISVQTGTINTLNSPWVEVLDSEPVSPLALQVSAGDTRLDLSWTAPSGTVTGYDVHYTTSTSAHPWSDPGSDPATGWVAVSRSGTAASQAITGLTNGTSYRVRVRWVNTNPNPDEEGHYAFATGTPQSGPPTVTISASPNPVTEGDIVSVPVTLSRTLSSNVSIPVTLTRGTAEADDYVFALTAVTVSAGLRKFTIGIQTNHDPDEDDETFTVSLGTLPSTVTAGSPSSVEITIRDDEGVPTPTVSLSATPNPVEEGERVNVIARLSSALPGNVRIPVTVTRGTAEADDYVAISSIVIPPGSLTSKGFGTMTTNQDGDTDDETFTVALDTANLPSSVTAGSPSSVQITIKDDDGGSPPDDGLPPDDNGGSPPDDGGGSPPDDDGDGDDDGEPPAPVNRSPEAADDRARTKEDTEVVIDVLANDTDADGDALRVVSVTAPSHGTARISDGGAGVVYAPEADYHGTDRFSYEVSDGSGGTATAEVEVTVAPADDAPVAMDDTARTKEDTEVVIDVLANDTDVDGDALRVVSVTAPSLGTARISDGGAGVLYAPEADRHGTDRFSYEVSDGHGGTATAEVEVTVEPVNDAPVAAPDTARTREDTEVSLDVLSNDTDVDGDALRVVSVTAPSLGTARISDGGAGVLYAPEADRHGTDRFSYEVSDGHGGTATAEVEVTVEPVNDAPVAAPDTGRTKEDTKVVLNVLSNDTDVDGDALRVVSVTAPSLGTARISDGGAGVLYAPEADRHGTDRFSYEVSDGHGGTATAEVEVTVESVNDAPVAVVVIPDQTLDEGGADVAIDLAPHFEDRDGDALAYSAVSSDPGLVAVTVAGSMLTLKAVGYGNASVEVMARDPGGLEARQTFRVGASDRMVRAALDETLAAMGRAHLASARMTLGRFVRPGGAPSRSMLKVKGRHVPLGRTAVREAAMQMLQGWAGAVTAGAEVGSRGGRQDTAYRHGGRSGMVTHAPAGLASALTFGGRHGGTEWMFAFGEEQAPDDGGGRPWRFWGQGDLQTFTGVPTPQQGYEGDLRTGWAGIDRAIGKRWLAGVAVARSRGIGDWHAGSAGGRLETTLTALHPYLRWSDGTSSLWAMAGGGLGTAENARTTGRVGETDLTFGLGLFEVRRSIAGWFGLRADGGWVRLSTVDGAESVDGHLATVDQQRLGIELHPSSRHVGLALQASARRDGGAGQTGTGMELSGGIRVAGGPFRIDAQGRILVLHSSENYEERGLGARISVGSPSAEEGLSLSVSPRWGGPAVASGELWREKLVAAPARGPGAREAWTVDSSARYAHRLSGGSLVYLSGGLSSSARGLAIMVSGGIAPGATRR